MLSLWWDVLAAIPVSGILVRPVKWETMAQPGSHYKDVGVPTLET